MNLIFAFVRRVGSISIWIEFGFITGEFYRIKRRSWFISSIFFFILISLASWMFTIYGGSELRRLRVNRFSSILEASSRIWWFSLRSMGVIKAGSYTANVSIFLISFFSTSSYLSGFEYLCGVWAAENDLCWRVKSANGVISTVSGMMFRFSFWMNSCRI